MTTSHRKHAAALIVALLTSFAFSARAEAHKGIVVVGGSANEHDRGHVRSTLEKAVADAGWGVLSKPLAKRDIDALLGCNDAAAPWTCLPASFEKEEIRRILLVSVSYQQSDAGVPMVVLTGQIVAVDSRATAANSQFCEQCADDKLATKSSELAQQLLRDLAVRIGRTIVEVASDPDGAQVTLDGKTVGVTSRAFNTYPGPHTILVEKPGYERIVDEIEVEEGATVSRSYRLVATTTTTNTPIVPPPPSPSRVVPSVLIGGGVVLAGLGSYFLYRGLADDERYEYTRATPVGLTTIGLGTAAVITGVVLWRRGSKAATSAPSATVGRDGGVVGWSGTF